MSPVRRNGSKDLSRRDTLRITHPERVFALRIAYLEYRDRFEAVGVADLDHDDLTDVFRGPLCTPRTWNPLTCSSLVR